MRAVSFRTALMNPIRIIRLTTGAAAAVMTALYVLSPAAAQTPFHLEEATIVSIHAAFASGQLN